MKRRLKMRQKLPAKVRIMLVTMIAAGSVEGVVLCTTLIHRASKVASSDIPPSRTSSSPFKAEEQHLQIPIHIRVKFIVLKENAQNHKEQTHKESKRWHLRKPY